MIKLFAPACLILAALFSACSKQEGPGGEASIRGRIMVLDYNGNCSELLEEYPGIDEEVYIIYGDDPSYSERIRTGPDGIFWFPYLRKGDYTVYALTEPCNVPGQLTTEEVQVSINSRKQEVNIGDLVVIR